MKKIYENLNFITYDKLKINLWKTYAKLRIFPKIFLLIGPQVRSDPVYVSFEGQGHKWSEDERVNIT